MILVLNWLQMLPNQLKCMHFMLLENRKLKILGIRLLIHQSTWKIVNKALDLILNPISLKD